MGTARLWSAETARAVEICERGARAGTGAIVFVGGGPASGRSTLLEQVGAAIALTRPSIAVHRGGLVAGRYVAVGPGASVRDETLQAVEQWLGLAGHALPLAGLLAQLAAAGRSGARALALPDVAADAPSFERLFEIFRSATRSGPIACLIDDCDELDGRWWSELLLGFAAEIERLPLFLFLTLDSARGAGRDDVGPDALFAARSLVERDLAEWWELSPVEESDLVRLTGPAEDSVLGQLRSLTEGRAGLAACVWGEWRRQGIVERDTDLGPWRFQPGQPHGASPSIATLVRGRLAARLDELATVEAIGDVLECAALEGRTFTAEAVATAVGRDPDDVMDLLDDRLASDREPAIVEEIGFVTVRRRGRERALCRYGFSSPLVRAALAPRDLTTSRSRALILSLARGLESAYGDDASLAARTLARLYAQAGETARSRRYRQLAGARMPDRVLLEQARPLLALDPTELSWHEAYRATIALLDAGQVLHGTGPLDEVVELGGRAAALARRTGIAQYEGEALRMQGTASIDTGDRDAGRSCLELAAGLLGEAGLHVDEADALENLAWLESLEGRLERALDLTARALAIWRNVGDRQGELGLRLLEVQIATQCGETDLARRSYAAATLLGACASPPQRAELAAGAGWLANEAGDRHATAIHYTRAVDLYVECERPRFAIPILTRLGDLLLEHDPAAARSALRRALELNADLDHPEFEALALELLAAAERRVHDGEDASR
jgi:tetratricopeptide (TPR) repeat protein